MTIKLIKVSDFKVTYTVTVTVNENDRILDCTCECGHPAPCKHVRWACGWW